VHTLWRDHHQLKATTAVSAGVVNKLPASPNQAVEVADLKTQIRRVTQDLLVHIVAGRPDVDEIPLLNFPCLV
jgi:hypothetical protein